MHFSRLRASPRSLCRSPGLSGPRNRKRSSPSPLRLRRPSLRPHVQVPSSNPLSGDPEAIALGKRLFFTWCVQCHGPKANGESRFGKYAGDLTRFWRGYPEFVIIVKNGRPQKQMPPWKEVLDEDNIAKVGAYLETLSVEGANWK